MTEYREEKEPEEAQPTQTKEARLDAIQKEIDRLVKLREKVKADGSV